MLISEAFERHISTYAVMKGLSLRTLKKYDDTAKMLIREFGDIPLSELTQDMVCKWHRGMGTHMQNNTIRIYICALRQVLKRCGALGEPCLNAELIPVPKTELVTPSYLTAEEVERMIDSTSSLRNKLLISLMYSSGVRRSECRSLNCGQIVNGRFTIIGKGGKERLCFIDSRTEKLLNKYLETRNDSSKALFISKSGKRIPQNSLYYVVKLAAERAGIKKEVHPHTLRHSFATNFLQNGGNMRYLAALMGHSNMNVTARYAHVVDIDLHMAYVRSHTT